MIKRGIMGFQNERRKESKLFQCIAAVITRGRNRCVCPPHIQYGVAKCPTLLLNCPHIIPILSPYLFFIFLRFTILFTLCCHSIG